MGKQFDQAEFSGNLRDIYPFKSQFIEIDNHRMHYVDEGDKDAEVILFVHGNPTWSFAFRDLIKNLSKDYRCIAIDHINCGFSDRVDELLRLKDRVTHLNEFITKMKLVDINLIAHDWGGAIGLGTLVKRVELFKSITLFNTGAFLSENIPKRIAICRVPLIGSFLNRRLNSFALAAQFMTTHKSLDTDVKKGYLYPYRNYRDRRSVDDFVMDIPMEGDHPTREYLGSIGTNLHRVNLPVQLIWGSGDFCFDVTFFDKFKKIWPKAKSYFLDGAGHYVFEDKREFCLEKIREFIS